jgi:hypothetical protein
VPPEHRYQGIIGACVGIGNTIGPFLAAAFVEKASRRHLFFMLCGLSTTSGVLAFFLLPSTRLQGDTMTKLKKIDYWGTLFSSAAVVFLLVPISDGGVKFAWNSPTSISLLVVCSICALMFLVVEWKVAILPMMPCNDFSTLPFLFVFLPFITIRRFAALTSIYVIIAHLFKNLAVSVVLVQNFLFGVVYYSSLYYLPMYYQNARRWEPTTSAALTCPIVVVQGISSVLSGQYISRRKRYGEVLWIGYVFWTIGAGLRCLFGKTTSPISIIFISILGDWVQASHSSLVCASSSTSAIPCWKFGSSLT